MPVRKPPKNFRSLTGAFYSYKNKKTVYFESKLEKEFFLVLEFDKNVVAYEEQPISLSYKKNGRTYPYTPDCLVHYEGKTPSCIVEVKYSEELEEKKDEFAIKFDQIKKYLDDNGFDFQFFSELDINSIAFENMNYIYNFVTIQDEDRSLFVLDKVKNFETIMYQDLLEIFSEDRYEQAKYIPYIWFLVLEGKMNIDINARISNETILEIVG